VLPGLRRRLAWLPTLAIVAVLLGFLGALVNLHGALELAARSSTSLQVALLEGIAYAVRPLGAGVFTAIPLVLGHAYLVSESEAIASQLAEFAARLVNALLHRPDVRLGHR
jgi:biopolymer transport protein ExbB/TolQ